MTKKISRRDWEAISAYLDGQLSVRKQAHLESRLQQEPQLCQAFDELRETRQVLRNTPHLRAPRNFLLTPEMAGHQYRIPRLSPFFGWASVVTGLFLVFVLVADIFSAGGAIPVVVSQDTAQMASSEVVIAPEAAGDEAFAETPAMKGAAAGGYAEPEANAVPEEEAMMQAAAEEPEAVVVEETEPTSDGVESEVIVSGAVVKDATETPQWDRAAEAMPEGTTVVLSAPETDDIGVNATEQPQEMPEDEEFDVLPEEAPTDFPPTATMPQLDQSMGEQPTEMALVENAEPPPAEKALPVVPQPEPLASEAEPTEIVPVVTETPAHIQEESSDILLGAEAVLALLAVGLGVAWLYLRRRGG